ncbi:MAG: 23S rRNA (pseudouridine(1915)-N(3))-methyltransferase RlmH [Bacteroidaceae bacterium]|nr:23S rRNA (pseudouridine(1915)-N(3))-methyltransferase RlmH [Bacteroidaceae bacterium]MCR4769604.1 23S rRNA (pseudouridine(1915)-N(3))-methyltransferase RlmH [Bacteroidaceae bacterium]
MKTTLIQVGKTTSKDFQKIIDEYTDRLKHYTQFSVTTIPELKNTKALSAEQQKQLEAEQILRQISDSDYVVLLDEHGKEFRSIELAGWIEKKQISGLKHLIYIIGGPYGFAQSIYKRANEQLSLSKLTFSHQMIRILFTEQLYRAYTIINGEKYHHE